MKDRLVQFRCPQWLLEKIDAFAMSKSMSRSEVCRSLVNMGIEQSDCRTPYSEFLASLGYGPHDWVESEDLDKVAHAYAQWLQGRTR